MKLIRLKEVMSHTGLGRSSIYKFMNEGRFPKSVPLGDRAIAFVEDEVNAWVQDKIDLRDESEQQVSGKEAKPLKEADVIAWLKDKLKQYSLSESIEWLMKIKS